MIITRRKTIEVRDEATILKVKADARYWEDGNVNNIEDIDGSLIPCRVDNYWCPEIDTGRMKIK